MYCFLCFVINIKTCILYSETWLCDHEPDCGLGDSSDERDCAFEVCDDALQFTCRNKRCIPLANVCDGIDNCNDASDEWEVSHGTCAELFMYLYIFTIFQCKKGCNNDTEFSCDKTKCLPMMLRCK